MFTSKFANFETVNAVLGNEMFEEKVERAMEQAKEDLRIADGNVEEAVKTMQYWLRMNGFKKSASKKNVLVLINAVK